MIYAMARKTVVTSMDVVSRTIPMPSFNSVQVSVVVFVSGSDLLTAQVQGSNDLENWVSIGSPIECPSVGAFFSAPITGVAFKNVRLLYAQDGGTSVLAGTINVAET
jgi:hypothetical protein